MEVLGDPRASARRGCRSHYNGAVTSLRSKLKIVAALALCSFVFAPAVAEAKKSPPQPKVHGRGVPTRFVLVPRLHLLGGGGALLWEDGRTHTHLDVTAEATVVALTPPRLSLATADRTIRPFARARGRFAVVPENFTLEIEAEARAYTNEAVQAPLLPDFTAPVGWIGGAIRASGRPIAPLRLTLSVDGFQQGASARAGTPQRATLGAKISGALALFEYGSWKGQKPAVASWDHIENGALLNPGSDELIAVADAHPLGGFAIFADVDFRLAWLEGALWRPPKAPPLLPTTRIEAMGSLPLPAPWVRSLWPALEGRAVAGAVWASAPGHVDLAYGTALTRDPRASRGETLLQLGVALRGPLGPAWSKGGAFLLIGAPMLQVDWTMGDTWGYGPSVDLKSGTRRLPGPNGGDTAPFAGEVGVELRLPMLWGPMHWNAVARFEVGLRSGDGVLPALSHALPWSWDDDKPPMAFTIALGTPIR